MSAVRQVQEFRDQAARFRRMATDVRPRDVCQRYTNWAVDLERRADIIEAELRDRDGTAIAAANGDLPVLKDCQARAVGIAQ